MTIQSLNLLAEWILNKENYSIGNKSSFLSLLSSCGCENLIWLNIVKDHISIEAFTNDLTQTYIQKIITNHHENLRLWIKNNLPNSTLLIDHIDFSCILLVDDYFNNYSLILGGVTDTDRIKEIQYIAKIGFVYISQASKIQVLENSLIHAHSELQRNQSITRNSIIFPDDLPKKFISESVPAIWYAVAHESVGPMIVTAIPHELYESYNLVNVVNVFSPLDSEMIGQLGHVFSITPMKHPLGESTNIVFSINNALARGEIELHSITIVIGQDFVNLSKSLYLEIKSALFTGVEAIRQKVGEKAGDTDPWNIAISDPINSLDAVKSFMHPILKTIQATTASLFASLMNKEDVENW